MFVFFQQKLITNLKISRMIGALDKSMILNLGKNCYKYSNKYIRVLSCFYIFFFASIGSYYTQCTGTISTSVTSDYNGSDVSCAGVCDGEITITMSSGGPYGYQLLHQNTNTYFPGPTVDDFQASPVFSNLCQGDYDVTVLDSTIEYVPGLIYGECNSFESISEAAITSLKIVPDPNS